eukprot:scaffold2779_cov376-Prasinococcus_capsulatus_cf.AAC.5
MLPSLSLRLGRRRRLSPSALHERPSLVGHRGLAPREAGRRCDACARRRPSLASAAASPREERNITPNLEFSWLGRIVWLTESGPRVGPHPVYALPPIKELSRVRRAACSRAFTRALPPQLPTSCESPASGRIGLPASLVLLLLALASSLPRVVCHDARACLLGLLLGRLCIHQATHARSPRSVMYSLNARKETRGGALLAEC